MNLRLLSVNIARARVIGTFESETVVSGIDKRPVAGMVTVSALGIAGDEQADLTVHGGPDKAVYAYPADNWPWWEHEHGLACAPARFGETLTVEGADEDAVRIGDRFRWGDVLLEVSQPRGPCYKLGIHVRRTDVPQIMTLSARCGWYLRVIEDGAAPARESVLIGAHRNSGPTVRDTFRAAYGRADAATMLAVHDCPALSASWRTAVAKRLQARRV